MKALALLLVGAWLAGSLMIFFVATQNFREVDRALASVPPQVSADAQATLRPILRHLSSELNRTYFAVWGIAQIVLGVVLIVLLHRQRTDSLIAAVMLAIAAGLLLAITPGITQIGRALDFVPRNPLPAEYAPLMARFWRLHFAYTGLDCIKVLLGFVLAWRLSR